MSLFSDSAMRMEFRRQESDSDSERVIAEELENIRADWQELNTVVRGLLGPTVHIDEMALLFPTDVALACFVRYAIRQPGYELFNSAFDRVRVGPLHTEYDAHYWFMTTPDYVPDSQGYRLELMTVSKGFSPLHALKKEEIVQEDHFPFCRTAHGSFKCHTEEAYGTAVHTLLGAGYEVVQRCRSSYGRFSYWQHNSAEEMPSWLLKPRVNLRDGSGEDA